MKSLIQKLKSLEEHGVVYATSDDNFHGDYYISEFNYRRLDTDRTLSIKIYYNNNLWDTCINNVRHFKNSIDDLYHHIIN